MTASVAMLVPAPGRFSTTNGRPSRSDSHCASSRQTTSVEPPGVNPTTMRTGRDGYACPKATCGMIAAAPTARRRILRRETTIATSFTL